MSIEFKTFERGWAGMEFPRYDVIVPLCFGKEDVADAACGGGYGSWLIARYAKQVHSFDISDPALGFCKTWKEPNITFTKMDLNTQDLPGRYDVVVSFETIEHLTRPIADTVDMFCSKLKAGGILCLSFPENEIVRTPWHVHYDIKRDAVRAMMEKNGLTITYDKLEAPPPALTRILIGHLK